MSLFRQIGLSVSRTSYLVDYTCTYEQGTRWPRPSRVTCGRKNGKRAASVLRDSGLRNVRRGISAKTGTEILHAGLPVAKTPTEPNCCQSRASERGKRTRTR